MSPDDLSPNDVSCSRVPPPARLAVALAAVVLGVAVPSGDAGAGDDDPPPTFVCTLPAGKDELPPTRLHGLIDHLPQYPAVELATPAQRRAAARLLGRLRDAARGWQTIASARTAGYTTHTAPRRAGDRLAHYLHAEWIHERGGRKTLDPGRPKALIFANEPGRRLRLVGVMFAMRRGERGPTPGGPITRWHSHRVCVVNGKRGRKPGPDGTCPPGGRLVQGSEMLHVWFTRDLRSAFAISAPEVELCRDRLLVGRTCAHPRTGKGM